MPGAGHDNGLVVPGAGHDRGRPLQGLAVTGAMAGGAKAEAGHDVEARAGRPATTSGSGPADGPATTSEPGQQSSHNLGRHGHNGYTGWPGPRRHLLRCARYAQSGREVRHRQKDWAHELPGRLSMRRRSMATAERFQVVARSQPTPTTGRQ